MILVKLGVSLRLKRGSIITVSVITVLNFEEYNLCMLDVRKPFADRTNHPIHPAGVTAAGPGSTPGGSTAPRAPTRTPGGKMKPSRALRSTPGGPTSTPSGPTDKKTSTPKPSSDETEATMAKRLTDLIRKQNQARRIDAK